MFAKCDTFQRCRAPDRLSRLPLDSRALEKVIVSLDPETLVHIERGIDTSRRLGMISDELEEVLDVLAPLDRDWDRYVLGIG